VSGRLGHVPAVARRAHAPSLAREGDDEPLRAPCAEGAGESEAEQPAREILAELLFDIARDVLLAGRAIGEPALEALRHDLVERRLLGAAALVTAGRRGAGVRTRERPRGKRGKRGDHSGTRGVAEYIHARTRLRERSLCTARLGS
jgi:hypothetical protein